MASLKKFFLHNIKNNNKCQLHNIETYIDNNYAIRCDTNDINDIDKEKIELFESKFRESIENKNSAYIAHNFALYYDIVRNDISKMIKYYKIAAQKKDIRSMHQLVLSCKRRNIRKDIIEKYSLKIVDYYNKLVTERSLKHHEIKYLHLACYNLGVIYDDNKKFSTMKKYMLVAIKNNALYFKKFKEDSIKCSRFLASHYVKNKNMYSSKTVNDEIIKYYLLAIDMDDTKSMLNLADYYFGKNDLLNAEKYYKMASNYNTCDEKFVIKNNNKKLKL